MSLYAEESQAPMYYQSFHPDDPHRLIHHFRLDGKDMTVETGGNWMAVCPAGDSLVSFYDRSQDGCSIDVVVTKLEKPPSNEKEAFQLYLARLDTIYPKPFVKDARIREVIGEYPQTYILAASETEAPNRISTFFYVAPNIYEVTLQVRSRLVGSTRQSYSNMLKSIHYENMEQPPLTQDVQLASLQSRVKEHPASEAP